MKILFVAPHLPHIYGGGLRMYYQVKYLFMNGIHIDLITYKADEVHNTDVLSFVNNLYQVGKSDNVINQFFRLIKPYPYYKNFEKKVLDIIKTNKYDLIHIHKFQMAEYFWGIKNIPIVIDLWACGLSGAWFEVLYESNFLIKMRKLMRIPKYYFLDKLNYNEFNNFFVVSDIAKKYIDSKYKNKKVFIVPNGVEKVLEKKEVKEKNNSVFNLIFTGDMAFHPNKDAVIYFYKNIYSYIKKDIKNLNFYIVGRNPDENILSLSEQDESIIITGMVNNIEDYLIKADIFVASIRGGLGIRNKIIEAMAGGLCVVGFKNCFEGIDVKNGENAIICKNAFDFIDKIKFLYKNKELLRKIGDNAKKTIKDKYLWENIAEDMIKNYYEILNSNNNSR